MVHNTKPTTPQPDGTGKGPGAAAVKGRTDKQDPPKSNLFDDPSVLETLNK